MTTTLGIPDGHRRGVQGREDPGQFVEFRVERALCADDLVERGAADLVPAEADHFPRIVVCQRIDCRSPRREASTRSNEVGFPPDWMCPSTVSSA